MTSVEFLIKFCLNDLPIQQWNKYNGLFEQAKEMEKQQIFDAHENGHNYYDVNGISKEQYYNETFKNK